MRSLNILLIDIKIAAKIVALCILSMIALQWYHIIHHWNMVVNPTVYTIEETSSHCYTVDLGNTITDGDTGYLKLAKWIRARDKHDKITFEMHCYGGSVMSEGIIISAIKATKAHTVAHVVSGSFSAGAGISCAAEEVQMDPYTFLMFHQAHSSDGKQLPKDLEIAALQQLQECKKHHILNQNIIDYIVNGDKDTAYYYYPGKEVNENDPAPIQTIAAPAPPMPPAKP